MRKKFGFSLVELLVVIVIIALLIAILIPGIAKARLQAQRSACLANTRSIGTALHTYMSDWNSLIPFDAPTSPNFWVLRLGPYGNIDKVRQCPAAVSPNPAAVDAPGTASTPWTFASSNPAIGLGCYGLNGWFYTTTGASANLFTTTALVDPAATVSEFWQWPVAHNEAIVPMIGDCISSIGFPRMNDLAPTSPVLLEQGPGSIKTDQMQRFTIARHGKAINIAFADGHSEIIRLGDLWTLKWTPQWNRNISASIP